MFYSDFLNIARRHKVTLALIFIFCLGVATALCVLLPRVFQSSATILIEVADVQTSSNGGYIDAQLEKVEARAQSDDNLWSLIEKYDLYSEYRGTEKKKQIIGRMRQDIEREIESFETVNPHAQKGSAAGTFLFTLAYSSDSAVSARDVTRDIANLYVQENAITRSKKAEEVSGFLEEVVSDLKNTVEGLAQKFTTFRKDNVNALPEQEMATREFLEKAEYDLELIRDNILGWSTRKRQIESQIAVASSGDLSVNDSISELKVQLNEARARYSELHPDVRKLKAEINAMQNQVRSGRGSEIISQESKAQRSSQKAANINRQAALAEVDQKLRAGRLSQRKLEEKISEYETRLINAPTVGLEYAKLNRELEEATKNYQQMKDKLMEAKLDEQVEKESKGERYIVHKNAFMPTGPISPNVPIIMALGLILGMGLCVGFLALMSLFDRKIYGPAGVSAIFEAPPLAVIPVIQ